MSYNYTPYNPATITESSMATVIENFNNNVEDYIGTNGTLSTLNDDMDTLAGEISEFGYTGSANAISESNGRKFASPTEKETWNENSHDSLTSNLTDTLYQNHVVITNYFADENIQAYLKDGSNNPTTMTTFLPRINRVSGAYTFKWSGSAWLCNDNVTTLEEYGITVDTTGATLVPNDYFIIHYYDGTSPAADATSIIAHGVYDIPLTTEELINDGESGTPYIEQRPLFRLESFNNGVYNRTITPSKYESNNDAERNYYAYKAVITLNDFLYTSTGVNSDVNNCIYKQELKHIEDYTAILTFSQADADCEGKGIISKVATTKYSAKTATLSFNTTLIPPSDNPTVIESIIFIKQKARVLPDAYSSVSYLKSTTDGHQYVNTDTDGTNGYVAELIMIFENGIGSTTGDYNAIIGNKNSIGLQYDGTKWNWAIKIGSTVTSSDVEITSAKLYYLRLECASGAINVYANGVLVLTNTSALATGGNDIFLYASNNGSGTAENFSAIRIYSCKIYKQDVSEVLGDYDLGVRKSDNKPVFYDYVFNSAKIGEGLIPGIETDISDYIIGGHGAPNIYITRGAKGQFYKDLDTGNYYLCTNVIGNSVFLWELSMVGLSYTG